VKWSEEFHPERVGFLSPVQRTGELSRIIIQPEGLGLIVSDLFCLFIAFGPWLGLYQSQPFRLEGLNYLPRALPGVARGLEIPPFRVKK
jgi:hypothetical protein